MDTSFGVFYLILFVKGKYIVRVTTLKINGNKNLLGAKYISSSLRSNVFMEKGISC